MSDQALSHPAPHSPVRLFATSPNFRDLGGYDTGDGRRVRRGVVYRSGQMAMLSDEDAAAIDRLGIQSLVDLRTVDERTAFPVRWLRRPAHIYESAKASTLSIVQDILSDPGTPEGAKRGFLNHYIRIPDAYHEEYGAIFRHAAEGRLPLLIKCTAGKDRTGVGCALLLSALNVPRQTVLADYAATNANLAALRELRGEAPIAGAAAELLRQKPLSEEAKAMIWSADPAYLNAALTSVEERYGSVEAYVTGPLSISRDELETVRERLTEPA